MRNYNLAGLDVFVVEHSPYMRTVMSRVFRELGITKLRVDWDIESAFEKLKVKPADVIFTDWSPRLDGLKFAYQVRRSKRSPNPFAPIVMVSGYSETHNVLLARDVGVTEFLAKPISARAMYDRVRSVIERVRPFVRTTNFLGPDRRRGRDRGSYDGPDRREIHVDAAGLEMFREHWPGFARSGVEAVAPLIDWR